MFRGWYDFGSGILGDMGYYSLWPVFMAFGLPAPLSVEANASFTCEIKGHVSGVQENKVSFPIASTMRFKFPARGDKPPLELYWYDGGMKPPTPAELEMDGKEMPSSGMLFVGDSGKILGDFLGNQPRIIPEKKMLEYQGAKEAAERESGHREEWIEAFKGGKPSEGNFENARACAEMVCLGSVALRVGRKLEWDSENMQITNVPEANDLLRRQYRQGWEL